MSTPVLCALSVVATPDKVGPGLQSPLRPRGPADRPPPGSQPSQTSSDLSPSPGLERSIHGPRPPPRLLPPTPGPAPASMSLAVATWGQTQSPHGTPEDGEEGGACTGQCGAPGPRQAQLGAPETGLPHRSVGGGGGGHAQAVHTVGQAADGAHFQHLEPRGGVSPLPPQDRPPPELPRPLLPGVLGTRAASASAVDHASDSAQVHPHPIPLQEAD